MLNKFNAKTLKKMGLIFTNLVEINKEISNFLNIITELFIPVSFQMLIIWYFKILRILFL